jgi:transposase InsO family protein
MDVIFEGKSKGVKRSRICEVLQVDERRIRRWFSKPDLADGKPGPIRAPHALLPEEREAITEMAKSDQYVDDSHRVLTAKGVDAGCIAVSASSVYRVMRQEGLTTDRSGRSHRNGNSRKPERPDLTEPNKRWCWDISYLLTKVPGIFLYLYALLDEYSRKVVAFRISWRLSYAEGKELVDEGIAREGLTAEQVTVLELFNDRGSQMKAVPFKRFLEGLGISQKFARPRTPNDNPFVESLFSTTKGALAYPGVFIDDVEALAYFTAYFDYYNNVRLHGEIGYVTPAQRHSGEDRAILHARVARLKSARRLRLMKNRERVVCLPGEEKELLTKVLNSTGFSGG